MLTYKNILENIDVGIVVIQDGKYLSNINLAFKEYLSLEDDVKDVESLLSLIDTDPVSIANFNVFINFPENETSLFILNLYSGHVLGCKLKRISTDNSEALDLLTIQDLTSQERKIRQLTIASEQDELTGVANRRKFEYEFSRIYEFAQRTKITGALILIDLDNFKTINDRFGHSTGDSILKQVRLALSPVIRNYEMLARVGGDEFAILVSHSGEQAVERLFREVPLALTAIKINPNDEANNSEVLVASMGSCIFPANTSSYKNVYEIEDKRMYEHKNAAKNIPKKNN